MGNQLQKLHVFNESIAQSANALDKKGFNLYSVLKSTDPVVLQDPLLSVVASTAIQVCIFFDIYRRFEMFKKVTVKKPNAWEICV